jgi:pyruvate dehydrogenase E2 component (dihydrolipoamide acetyltransferase)
MAKEFKLPELGENIESADIISVLVKVGDRLEKDQSIIEIETDKATIEVPSSLAGTVSEVLVKEGESVMVGAVLIKVDDNGVEPEQPSVKTVIVEKSIEHTKEYPVREEDKLKTGSVTVSAGKTEIVYFVVPDLGENIEAADVIDVLVKPGDMLAKDQGVIEIETDKATIEVPSNIEGKILEVNVKAGSKVKVGEVLLKVESTINAKVQTIKTEPETVEKPVDKSSSQVSRILKPSSGAMPELQPGEIDKQPPFTKGSAPAAPSVRRIAREIGVDINEVKGSGPGGRISMDDVKAHSKKLHQERKAGAGSGIKHEALPDFTKYGEIEKVEMSKIRKVTAEHLSYAWAAIPHVTQFDKADITQLEKSRKEANTKILTGTTKLTVTAILVKVIASALKKFPQFNSSIDMETKHIIYKKYYNVGIAVDTGRGLIVPVMKNADKKNLSEIATEMSILAEKARERKILLDELQGGCFTITNLGGIGGTSFTPVVNSPEVAILGISRGSFEPVYNGSGVFEPRLMLPLSLSYDHRIIDGADAVRFLNWIIENLEQPLKLLIEG